MGGDHVHCRPDRRHGGNLAPLGTPVREGHSSTVSCSLSITIKRSRSTTLTQRRHALRDDPWDRLQDLLPGRPGHVGVTARDHRLFVEAVIDRYRPGIPWRELPARLGDCRVVHTRFSCWARAGVWPRVFEILAADADNEDALLDSTLVRAHPHRAGAPKKRVSKPLGAATAG